jgi:hypothetical protein
VFTCVRRIRDPHSIYDTATSRMVTLQKNDSDWVRKKRDKSSIQPQKRTEEAYLFGRSFLASVLFSTPRLVGTSNPPQRICGGFTSDGSHNLLTTSSSQILGFTREKVLIGPSLPTFNMAQLDSGAACDGFLYVLYIQLSGGSNV